MTIDSLTSPRKKFVFACVILLNPEIGKISNGNFASTFYRNQEGEMELLSSYFFAQCLVPFTLSIPPYGHNMILVMPETSTSRKKSQRCVKRKRQEHIDSLRCPINNDFSSKKVKFSVTII